MKKINSIILAGAMACGLAACNDIDPADRLIEVPAVEAKRVVILEEFTGQACVNCPSAHENIEKLLEQYPANLIAVSLHAGPLSYHEDKMPIGLGNDQSNAYYKQFGSPSLPAGVVNRSANTTTTADKWAAAIREEVARPAYVDLAVDAKLAQNGKAIEATVKVSPHQNMDGTLMVWVVESGIVSLQQGLGGAMYFDYVHNHVFRQAVPDIDGTRLSLVTREDQEVKFTIDVKEKWNAANLSVVAFIYNNSGVQQAAQSKVE